jgi:hypothetical protein
MKRSGLATSTKKKRKEIDLPITIRLSGRTKSELDRLVEQEVKENRILLAYRC